MQQSYVSLFYLLGAAQGAFLAISLFFNRTGSHKANRYLCLFTLMLTLGLLDYFAAAQGDSKWLLNLRILSWSREFLFGVFIYFYARELTRPDQYTLSGKQWLHFLPAAIHTIALVPTLFVSPALLMALFTGQDLDGFVYKLWSVLLTDGRFALEVVHLPIYLVLSYQLLIKHEKRVQESFSYQESITLTWLRNLILGTLLIYLIWALEDIFSIGLGARVLLGIAIVCLIYAMGYLALRQPVIFVDPRLMAPVDSDSNSEPQPEQTTAPEMAGADTERESASQPYENSSLSFSTSKLLMAEINEYMTSSEIYLEPQLTLPQLADALGLSVPYVSQAINQQSGQNFFEFVNQYRLERVLKKLEDPADLGTTILDIGLAAGFNSKSAFYTAFKKHTNKTPSKFRSDAIAARA